MRNSKEHGLQTRATGFTLIEVLLATFILALGVLGLLALFAGAARQQQAATQTTASVFAANNAEVGLTEKFGKLTYPPGAGSPLDPGRWYTLNIDTRDHYLSLDQTLGGSAGGYFLLRGRNVGRALWERGGGFGALDDPMVGGNYDHTYVDDGTGEHETLPVSDFAENQIHPDSLSIIVTISEGSGIDANSDGEVDSRTERTVTLGRTPNLVADSYESDDAATGLFSYTLNGVLDHDRDALANLIPAGDRDWMMVQCELQGGTANARIMGFQIASANAPLTQTRIERITADYEVRNTRLMSLSDRMVMQTDSTAPGGRRPGQAFSVLFRRLAGSETQAAVVSYELSPVSSGSEFIPPERLEDFTSKLSPMREVPMSLRFDSEAEEFYFQVDDETTDLWAIEPGQVLIVARTPSGGAGSDGKVLVVRKVKPVTQANAPWRGYIDRAPRAGGRTMLPQDKWDTGAPEAVIVFALADSVKSLKDASVWRLRPLDIRVMQARAGN